MSKQKEKKKSNNNTEIMQNDSTRNKFGRIMYKITQHI